MSVTIEEIAKHSSDSDRWRIIGDEVFDVMSFLGEDPGGKKATMLFAGRDATEEFDMLHDRSHQEVWHQLGNRQEHRQGGKVSGRAEQV